MSDLVGFRRLGIARQGAWRMLDLIAPLWRAASNPRLVRVLAYHDVPDAGLFRRQIGHVLARYRPITAERMVAFLRGENTPPNSCWVTFDDADPSVIDSALPTLDELQVPATLFICPGLVDTNEPYWWQILESELPGTSSDPVRPTGGSLLAEFKGIPDPERRLAIEKIRIRIEEREGKPMQRRQITTEEIRQWVSRDRTIGNHTWDHPVLSMCDEVEQRRQINAAHDWLSARFGPPAFFAYPNGNYTEFSANEIRGLGYSGALLFDHRPSRGTDPFRVSRIRVNGYDRIEEFRAKVSGLHSAIHHALGRNRTREGGVG